MLGRKLPERSVVEIVEVDERTEEEVAKAQQEPIDKMKPLEPSILEVQVLGIPVAEELVLDILAVVELAEVVQRTVEELMAADIPAVVEQEADKELVVVEEVRLGAGRLPVEVEAVAGTEVAGTGVVGVGEVVEEVGKPAEKPVDMVVAAVDTIRRNHPLTAAGKTEEVRAG